MEAKIVIHNEYDKLGDGVLDTMKEMEGCSIEELRLWIIQELSTIDSECWWLVDVGIKILKNKMDALNKNSNTNNKEMEVKK